MSHVIALSEPDPSEPEIVPSEVGSPFGITPTNAVGAGLRQRPPMSWLALASFRLLHLPLLELLRL